MAITVESGLKVHLAETGDAEAAISGGSLKFYTAAAALIASCNVNGVSTNANGTLDVTFAGGVVGAGYTSETPDNAKLFKSDGTTALLSFSSITASAGGGDITFGTAAFDTNGTVNPGTMTLDLSGLTAS